MEEHDYRMMHKNRPFTSMLASLEANRHLPGLRNLLKIKLSGKTFSEAMIVVNLTYPVELNVLSPKDLRHSIPSDGSAHSARSFEVALQATREEQLSFDDGDEVTWLQVILPEGETQVVFVLKSKLFKDDFCASKPATRTVRLRRSVAVDDDRRKLATRWDEVDEILHHLNFQRADEWYSSGPGSMNQLNEKVEAIILKLRMLKSLTERLGGDVDDFEVDVVRKHY